MPLNQQVIYCQAGPLDKMDQALPTGKIYTEYFIWTMVTMGDCSKTACAMSNWLNEGSNVGVSGCPSSCSILGGPGESMFISASQSEEVTNLETQCFEI